MVTVEGGARTTSTVVDGEDLWSSRAVEVEVDAGLTVVEPELDGWLWDTVTVVSGVLGVVDCTCDTGTVLSRLLCCGKDSFSGLGSVSSKTGILITREGSSKSGTVSKDVVAVVVVVADKSRTTCSRDLRRRRRTERLTVLTGVVVDDNSGARRTGVLTRGVTSLLDGVREGEASGLPWAAVGVLPAFTTLDFT